MVHRREAEAGGLSQVEGQPELPSEILSQKRGASSVVEHLFNKWEDLGLVLSTKKIQKLKKEKSFKCKKLSLSFRLLLETAYSLFYH